MYCGKLNLLLHGKSYNQEFELLTESYERYSRRISQCRVIGYALKLRVLIVFWSFGDLHPLAYDVWLGDSRAAP